VLRLLNPLHIRFSQPRIAPHFRDGHLLEETEKEVHADLCIEERPAYEHSPDAAEGRPPYDLVVLPPFPAIRVISWMPKLRGADGEVERDSNGDQILGKRAWFALDNRRLWNLQTAAAKAWPKRCCAVVRCLEDVPGTTIRELRKFRTTTEGMSIELGVRCGDTTSWSWSQAAPSGARVEEDSMEGLFAEELWDALQWAPQAATAACLRDPEDFVPRQKSSASRNQAAEEVEEVQQKPRAAAPVKANGGYPQYPAVHHAPNSNGGASGGGRRGEQTACPEQGWQYIDPNGLTQGPFDRRKMRLWHEHGFFYPDLRMRCSTEDAFVSFNVLFPQPTEPFLGIVTRYKLQ